MAENEELLVRARELTKEIRSKTFSGGTYQVEVGCGKETFWPFLQLTDQGKILDGFCSCHEPFPCVHFTAAHLALCGEEGVPLHKRFRDSFWNQLCRMAGRVYGHRADRLAFEDGAWKALSLEGELLVSLTPLTEEGASWLDSLLKGRKTETEETSLKFSNLSEEELRRWKRGNPSEALRYELSFWSDLAKGLFLWQEERKEYHITCEPKGQVPKWIHVSFGEISCLFAIKKEELPSLISSFRTVTFPLPVYEEEELSLRAVAYDPQDRAFILLREKEGLPAEEGIFLGSWKFIEGRGFFHQKSDPLLSKDRVEGQEVECLLTRHASLLSRHLAQTIETKEHKLQVHLHMTREGDLHIEQFVFVRGDLLSLQAALFGRWAYLPDKGFLSLEPPLFTSVRTLIPKEALAEFIDTHRVWLKEIEGFAPHLLSVEASVSYKVEEKTDDLLFTSHMEGVEDPPYVVDLDSWVYVPERGFFPKKREGDTLVALAGRRVARQEVPIFLRRYRKELELVRRFFSLETPIEKISLKVSVNREGVHIKPFILLKKHYKGRRVVLYGDYAFVEGEGFSLTPSSILPSILVDYLRERTLSSSEEPLFFSRLAELEPWIEEKDPSLCAPKGLSLVLREMDRAPSQDKEASWLLDLRYESAQGSVSAVEVWDAIKKGRPKLCSSAGLLDLSDSSFTFLHGLKGRKGKGKGLCLTSLEWLRLQATEKIILPQGGEEAKRTRDNFLAFRSFKGHLPLSTQGLTSTLRPYQRTGLEWLWFLYCYGLSGLLCDEMGLGKTHQAMGLMAAVAEHQKEKKRFLVVCPTSVLYHWEEAVRRFLPNLSLHVFYGHARSLQDPLETCDVVLTSYGTCRTEKKRLSSLSFDLAVYDEIQQAKNPHSQIHKALKGIQARMRLGLTGTPLENRLGELKALLDLVLPHYLPGEAQFKADFLIPIEKEKDPEKRALLAKIIHPFLLRRRKADVLLELPAKVEEVAYCDLLPEQSKLYGELIAQYRQECRRQLKEGRMLPIFVLFSKLKQVCDHPCLLSKNPEAFGASSSGKWELFVELLEEARQSGQKVVVFTQYLTMMDIMRHYLEQQKIGFAEIRGSTRDRRGALQTFRDDPGCQVFLASLQAAGVGIDLTAASVVIHYDRWWNPARENQATDRVHRMGQSRGVQVFKLVTKRTIEEKIHELILRKRELFEEVIGFDDQDVAKVLSKQEMEEIFSFLEDQGST